MFQNENKNKIVLEQQSKSKYKTCQRLLSHLIEFSNKSNNYIIIEIDAFYRLLLMQ